MKTAKKMLSILLAVLMIISIVPVTSIEASAASGSDYTSNSVLAAKLDAIFSGDIDIYSNSACTSEVYMPVGTSMSNSTQYWVKSNTTGNTCSGWQCYIYANAVYNKLYNEWVGHGNSFAHSEKVVSGGASTLSYATLYNAGVRCGAYLRTTNQSSGAYNGNAGHSMIILSYNASNITYLEGNGDGNGAIRITTKTWSDFNYWQLSGKSRYVAHIVQPTDSYYNSIYPSTPPTFTKTASILNLTLGGTESGTVDVSYRNGSYPNPCEINFKSNNTSIVTVSAVVITAPSYGSASLSIIAKGVGTTSIDVWIVDTVTNKIITTDFISVNVNANTYTVYYNANGGTGAPASQTKTHGTDLTLSTTKPTRTGYTFLGWSTSSTATSATYSAGSSFTTNANTTLYAAWKANTYTISYNANGGTGAPSSQTKTHGTALTLSTTKPTRAGYTFLGWSTSSTATSATFSAGGSFTTNATTTLYAVWKANTYTVSYNANGGIGAPSSQTKTYGKTLTLSSSIPTRTGYTFLGWSTSSTATSATYSAGDSFTTNANITLYAVWKKAGHDINNDGIVNSNDTGLYKYNGTWYYVKNGDIDYTFTGLTKHTNGIWYYVENGVLDWSHTGLVKHTNGVWYYVQKGQLNWKHTGLVKHTNGIWYYVQNGQLNWSKTGLVKHTNGIWYYVQKGQLNWNKTGLVKHTDGNWYYVQKGQINWNYTGLVKHTNGKWYYVQKGKLNWNYTGYAYYNGKKYKVVKGEKV